MSQTTSSLSPTNGLARSPWGYCLVDEKTGRLVHSNDSFRLVFGLSEANIGEHTIDTLFKLGESNRAFDEISEAIARLGYWKGRVYTFADRKSLIDVETLIEPSAEVGFYEIHLLEHPRIGRNLQFSPRSEMHMLRILMDFTVDILLIRDHAGRILLANRAFRRAFGISLSTPLLDCMLQDFFDEASSERIREIDALVVERRDTITLQGEKLRTKKGNEEWWKVTVNPAGPAGAIDVGTIVSMHCITERKEWESELKRAITETKEASRAKTEFLSTISHEIRTPINGIIGAAELCLDHELDPDVRIYADTILGCGNDLLTIINDVLDFAKIDSGQMEVANKAFPLVPALQQVFETQQETARAKGIHYHLELDEDLPKEILGDGFRFRQSIQNLLSNAVKFTDTGSVTLRCTLTSKSSYGVTLRIAVVDTGIGIDQEKQALIFESFRQGDMSRTRKFGGCGLGLSISSELVHLMGGTLEMESASGEGTSFVITLPCEISTKPSSTDSAKNGQAEIATAAGNTSSENTAAPIQVLLVEDNAVNRVIAERRLERLGHHVTVATDGREAVKRVIEDCPEVVLMDLEMPEMDGLEATRKIRAHEAESGCRPVYIIAITAHAQATDRERCLKSGMNDYLSKPFRSDKFAAVLERASAHLASNSFFPAPSEQSSLELKEWFDSLSESERVDITDAAQIFCETVGEEIENLNQSHERKDFPQLKRIAHQMRGVAAIFNAERAVEVAAHLEESIQRGDLSRVQKGTDALESELLRLERGLRPLVGRDEPVESR